MSEKVKFKVGDLVYYPNISNKIGKIVGTSIIANDPYCLKVAIDDTAIFTTKDGRFAVNAPIPVIYHATQKNYEWLSATFPNVAFEPPPKRKEPREIILAMLKTGYPSVTLLSKENYELFLCDETNINKFSLDDYFIVSQETGLFIIDFVDGKAVLEGENE